MAKKKAEPSNLEKGIEFMKNYVSPEKVETHTQERKTGEMRWNNGTLEQEIETIFYHNDKANEAEYTWRPVPQVYVDGEPRIIAEDANSVTINVPTDGSSPMFEDANGNPITAEEAEEIVRRSREDDRDLPHNDDNGGFV